MIMYVEVFSHVDLKWWSMCVFLTLSEGSGVCM